VIAAPVSGAARVAADALAAAPSRTRSCRMQLIFTPIILWLMERRRSALVG
jgi:hypothetical protein